MADVKQKSKMDKPKSKNANAALPKDARHMLIKEYREAAGERANDAKQRPEQEAVGTVEDAMRSAKNHGVDAAKRAGRSLRGQNRSDVEIGKQGPVDNADVGEQVSEKVYSQPETNAERRQGARREAVNDRLRQKKVTPQADSHGGELPQGGQEVPPTLRGKSNTVEGIKTKPSSALSAKEKSDKNGFRLNTKTNFTAKAKQSTQKAKKLKQRTQAVVNAAKKAAVATVRAVKKAALVIAKAAAAAVKALLAAAGPVGVVLLIFIVIAAIAAILASPFGLFFSGEDEAAKEKMQQTVAAMSYDYHQNIQDIIRGNSHDEMHFEFINHGYQRTDNWIDVLAIYAVNTAGFGEEGMDIVELDDARIEKLRGVFWDMQKVTYEVKNEPIYDAKTDTSTDHYVLYIRAECIGAGSMADTYGFDSSQREVLEEMLCGDYDGYFTEMIGSAGLFRAIGDGGGVVGTGSFIWPSDASTYVRSPYGSRPGVGVGNFHYGIDIAAGENTNVLAADSGTVMSNSVHSSYGNHLLVDHGNGFSTLYGHMNTVFVNVGDHVEQGQVIGLCGNTGVSFGAHIHFEIRTNGRHVNPLQFFNNYTMAQ